MYKDIVGRGSLWSRLAKPWLRRISLTIWGKYKYSFTSTFFRLPSSGRNESHQHAIQGNFSTTRFSHCLQSSLKNSSWTFGRGIVAHKHFVSSHLTLPQRLDGFKKWNDTLISFNGRVILILTVGSKTETGKEGIFTFETPLLIYISSKSLRTLWRKSE